MDSSGSGNGQGNIPTNSSGNTRSTPASDVNMQQDSIPQDSFAYAGTGMEDIEFDLNAIQQQFNDATSGLSNDFFSFGGSMFGNTNQPMQLPTLSDPNQDATAMFDFSTLDPNFMSLVNSFDNTFTQPGPSHPQPTTYPPQGAAQGNLPHTQFSSQSQPAQPVNPFAATVTEETSTGFTPYLNPDYSPPGTDASPSMSTGYPLSRNDASAPTPGRHFEHLSNTINSARLDQGAPRPIVGEPNWTTRPDSGPDLYNSFSSPPAADNYAQQGRDGVDYRVEQALGDKTPEDPSSNVGQSSVPYSYSTQFQKPADTRAGFGGALDQEGYELVGGWFDANDLPRVARDHLYVSLPAVCLPVLISRLDLFFSGMRMFAQIFHVPRFFARSAIFILTVLTPRLIV
jgi:hypothetical protein